MEINGNPYFRNLIAKKQKCVQKKSGITDDGESIPLIGKAPYILIKPENNQKKS